MGYYGITLDRDQLDTFKSKWPCHGLPDKLWRLRFMFEANGDLSGRIGWARNGRLIPLDMVDGGAMLALCEDAQRMMHPEHADERYGKR